MPLARCSASARAMRIVSSDFSFRLCAFSVLSARILNATSGSGRSSAIDRTRADLAQRLQTMIAVRRPVAVVLADGDDRIEEAAELFDDIDQPLDVRLRWIALITASARRDRSGAPRAAPAFRQSGHDRRSMVRRRRTAPGPSAPSWPDRLRFRFLPVTTPRISARSFCDGGWSSSWPCGIKAWL